MKKAGCVATKCSKKQKEEEGSLRNKERNKKKVGCVAALQRSATKKMKKIRCAA
jgi:hypothetical protein